MTFFKSVYFNTTENVDFIPLIHDVRYAVRDANAKDGLAVIFIPLSGAGVMILEPIVEVIEGIRSAFEIFAEGDETADDKKKVKIGIAPRIKAAFINRQIFIPIKQGQIVLPPYEEPYLIDLEKKRERREVVIQIFAEAESSAQAGAQTGAQKGAKKK